MARTGPVRSPMIDEFASQFTCSSSKPTTLIELSGDDWNARPFHRSMRSGPYVGVGASWSLIRPRPLPFACGGSACAVAAGVATRSARTIQRPLACHEYADVDTVTPSRGKRSVDARGAPVAG